jgi:hypothetical protein
MRSTKTLLKLLLKNQHLFSDGLCSWPHNLYYNDIILEDEKDILLDYIHRYLPPLKYVYFLWKPYNITPRIKWIEYHISILPSYNRNVVKNIYHKTLIRNSFKLMLSKEFLFLGGLCGWWTNVSTYDSICISLRSAVLAYIHANKPFQGLNEGYWWKAYEIEPRKKWLDHHIKLLNKQINVLYGKV